MSKLNLVIGNPIEHSLSPDLHSFFYRSLDLQNKFRFQKQQVSSLELEIFLKNKAKEINGLAVTIPHKVEIIKHLGEVDLQAKNIGAVNTVVNKNHTLVGYNTDWLGTIIPLLEKLKYIKPSFDQQKIIELFKNFENPDLESLFASQLSNLPHINEHSLALKNKKVALIGAGGASRAIAYAVLKFAGELTIFNRTLENAILMKDSFRSLGFENIEAKSLDDIQDIKNFEIIINSTSVGLADHTSPISQDLLTSGQVVFDAVYKKTENTKLIEDAMEKNCMTITGRDMLFWQAVYQMRLHCGL